MTTSEWTKWTKKFIVIILDMMTLNCVTDKAELACLLIHSNLDDFVDSVKISSPGIWGVLNCVYLDTFDDIWSIYRDMCVCAQDLPTWQILELLSWFSISHNFFNTNSGTLDTYQRHCFSKPKLKPKLKSKPIKIQVWVRSIKRLIFRSISISWIGI